MDRRNPYPFMPGDRRDMDAAYFLGKLRELSEQIQGFLTSGALDDILNPIRQEIDEILAHSDLQDAEILDLINGLPPVPDITGLVASVNALTGRAQVLENRLGSVPMFGIPGNLTPDVTSVVKYLQGITAGSGTQTIVQYVNAIRDALNGDVTALEGDITALQTNINALSNTVTDVEGTVTALEQMVNTHETRLDKLGDYTPTAAFPTLTALIGTGWASVMTVTQVINALTTKVGGQALNTYASLTLAVNDFIQKIASLTTRVEGIEGGTAVPPDLQATIDNIQQSITTLQTNFTNFQNSVNADIDTIANTIEIIPDLNTDIASLMSQMTDRTTRLVNLETGASGITAPLVGYPPTEGTIQTQFIALSDAINDATATLGLLSDSLSGFLGDWEEMYGSSTVTAIMEETVARVGAVEDDTSAIQTDLQSVKTAIGMPYTAAISLSGRVSALEDLQGEALPASYRFEYAIARTDNTGRPGVCTSTLIADCHAYRTDDGRVFMHVLSRIESTLTGADGDLGFSTTSVVTGDPEEAEIFNFFSTIPLPTIYIPIGCSYGTRGSSVNQSGSFSFTRFSDGTTQYNPIFSAVFLRTFLGPAGIETDGTLKTYLPLVTITSGSPAGAVIYNSTIPLWEYVKEIS